MRWNCTASRSRPSSGPAFLVRDSKQLELDGVTTRKPLADTPVIRLDHCPGAIVRQTVAPQERMRELQGEHREVRTNSVEQHGASVTSGLGALF